MNSMPIQVSVGKYRVWP